MTQRQVRIALGHDQAGMAQVRCRVRMFLPFWMKWLAKVWRSAWPACPLGSCIVALAKVRRNKVMAEFCWPCSLQCRTILASSSAEIAPSFLNALTLQ